MEQAIGLGRHGTNNLGELWEIAAAISSADTLASTDPTIEGRDAYIITDSQFAIGCLTLGWNTKNAILTTLCATIKRMLAHSRLIWHIAWVPGHAGVAGNEVADAAANRGADRSKHGKGITNLLAHVHALNFTDSILL